jgi:NADPH2:quinone reductase
MKAIYVRAYGGPEQLQLEEVPAPEPGRGEVLVEVAAAGVNYYDTQLRSGLIKRPLPLTVGLEGAGRVVAAGADVHLAPGTRVGWAASMAMGSYATHTIVPYEKVIALPDAISFEQAATVLFAGMTAHHLACSTFALAPGNTCVVHSAAGGVGTILTQIAKLRGARVIAVVSSDAKAAAARDAGADTAVVWGRDDLVATVKSETGGSGADVVYDAVGLDTFEASLDCLRRQGLMVSYGEASGFVPPFDLRQLSSRGSLFITRTNLSSYIATRDAFVERAGDLLAWVADGRLKVPVFGTYDLADAASAHRALESRMTTGKLVLRCGAPP